VRQHDIDFLDLGQGLGHAREWNMRLRQKRT
jgi:hypothetical protein